MKVKICQLRDDLEECVRSLDLVKAQVLKDELHELEAEESLVNLDITSTEEAVS